MKYNNLFLYSKDILIGTKKSIENLKYLQENSKEITDKMNQTKDTSNQLAEISVENEKALNIVLEMSQMAGKYIFSK